MVVNQPDHRLFIIVRTHYMKIHFEIRDIKTGIMGKLGHICGSNMPFYVIFAKEVEKKSKSKCFILLDQNTF